MEALLREMEEYARLEHVPIINAKGKAVLIDVAAQMKPRRILEIGTAIGYSALLIAAGSAPEARITTLELDEKRAAVAEEFLRRSDYGGQIEILCGDAAVLLNSLSGPFDFVFMDAAKGQYPAYWEKVVPLLANGGVIVTDNVLFRGYVESEDKPPRRYKTIVARLRQYLKTVRQHPDFDTVLRHDGDGLAVSYHRGNGIEET